MFFFVIDDKDGSRNTKKTSGLVGPGFPFFCAMSADSNRSINIQRMFRSVIFSLLCIVLLGGCFGKGDSELSKALSGAVRDNKISQKKMDSILKEYKLLVDQDQDKARKYALDVISVIDMGGDSSHIDVVRTRLIGGKAKKEM